MNFKYTIISEVGNVRKNNEDSLGVYKIGNGVLAIVCDGLGGNNAGEVASRLAVDTVHNYFKNSSGEDYSSKVKSAIAEADKTILRKSKSDYSLFGMSTTIEVLFIKDYKAYTGHVGDSRIYLFSDDKLSQVTKDHSYVQKLIDDGLLSEKDAEDHPDRNIITRALGDTDSAEADIDIIDLQNNNDALFFVCTDGVTGVVDDKELEEIFKGKDLNKISDKITDLVEKRGAPDNFSFALVKIE